MSARAPDPWRTDAAIAAGVGLVYYLLTRATLAANLGPGELAGVWPQSGLALAAILRARRAWSVVLAIVLAHLLASIPLMPLGRALAFGVADLLEPVCAAWVLRRACGEPFRLRGLREVAAFLLLGAGLSNAATALAGATAACIGSDASFASSWWVWWVSDGLGMASLGSLLLAASDRSGEARPAARWPVLELGLACGMLGALGIVYGARPPGLAFPLLLWPALRLGVTGASAALCALTGMVMLRELYVDSGPKEAFEAQGLLWIAAVCALVPAAVMADRRRAEEALRLSQEQLARDVEATQAARRALEESEERYRTLFEHAPIGLGVADLTGRLMGWNEAMMEPGGYTREDIERIGNVAALYADPEARAAALEIARRDGRLDRHAVRFLRKDGSTYEALMTLRPISLHGQRGWLAMSEDVTARRQAEEDGRRLQAELQHARRMEAVGVFAAGVAHDFNNLLTAIYGWTDLGSRRADADRVVREAFAEVRSAADQASAITRSLLAFSRKAPAARRPLDLGGAVREGGRLFRTLVPAGVELAIDAADEVWTEADPAQIQQVLMNLLLNACDAMPGGGRVGIAVRLGERGPLDGPSALLVVEDTGVGIADDVRERLFEPFFTTKTRERGTGLGLAVVHGIVTSLAGRVLVDSAPGRGTRMTVALPPCPPPPAPSSAAAAITDPPATPRGARGLALVAEDDPLVRRTLEEGLSLAGFHVRAAGDGEEALEALGDGRDVTLLVLDVDLPRRSGPSCLREARARGVAAPALVVSGNVALAGAIEPDARVRVLEKPFDLARLQAAVEELLG